MSFVRRPAFLVEGVALAVAMTAGVACASRSPVRGSSPPPSPPAAQDLVGEGTRPLIVRSADLDGDGVAEIAIAAVSEAVDELGLATPSLGVFDVRDGRWVSVFDAAVGAPPGAGAPPDMLAPMDQGFVSQSVDTLEVVDFAGDGRPELVAGILNFGAAAGPLELWVVSLGPDGSATTDFYEASARGGTVEVRDGRLRFEFGVYRGDDPGCCPSRIAVQTIGWDPESSRIDVLDEERSPVRGD